MLPLDLSVIYSIRIFQLLLQLRVFSAIIPHYGVTVALDEIKDFVHIIDAIANASRHGLTDFNRGLEQWFNNISIYRTTLLSILEGTVSLSSAIYIRDVAHTSPMRLRMCLIMYMTLLIIWLGWGQKRWLVFGRIAKWVGWVYVFSDSPNRTAICPSHLCSMWSSS